MSEKLINSKELAQLLNVTMTTIRNYVQAFAPHLSQFANRATGRLFTPEDIKLLERASLILKAGATYTDVKRELELIEEQPPAYENVELPEESKTQEPQRMELALVNETFKAMREHIETLKKDKEKLERELKWYRLPWYKKIFRDVE